MNLLKKISLLVLIPGLLFSCSGTPGAESAEKEMPLIGLSSVDQKSPRRAATNLSYVNSVKRAGGVPVVIPMTADSLQLEVVLDHVQGIVMTGGEDVNPDRYGHAHHPDLGKISDERDAFDLMLVRMAIRRNIPVLAICRGEQVLNVAFGGTLYQDIPSELKDTLDCHDQDDFDLPADRPIHGIRIEEGSLLHRIMGTDTVQVNSYHHQCVRDLAPGFVVTARSASGIVEAVEMEGNDRVLGVQFHPEGFVSKGDDTFLPLFRWLIEKSSEEE